MTGATPEPGNSPTSPPLIPLPPGVSWQDVLQRLIAISGANGWVAPQSACAELFGPAPTPVDPVTRDLIRRLADALEYWRQTHGDVGISWAERQALDLIEEARRV